MKGKAIAQTAKAALPPPSPPKRARYPALAHLPKTPLPRGVTYRHRTPGSSLKLIAFAGQGKYIDPAHPAINALSSSARGGDGFTFHRWKSPTGSFNMVAAPSAFLFEPDERKWYPYLELSEKWEDKVTKKMKRNEGEEEEKVVPYWKRNKTGAEQPLQDVDEGSEEVLPELCDAEEGPDPMQAVERILERRRDVLSKAVPISLRFATNKAAMGGRPIYASKVRQRVRNAVSLIVTHGAKAKAVEKESRSPVAGEEGREGEGEGKEPMQKRFELVCDLKEVEERKDMPGQGWILKDWTYLIFPTMNLYRMPIQDLIAELREALGSVWAKGMHLNKKWMKQSIRERKAAASAPSTVSADRPQLSRGFGQRSAFQESSSLTGDKPRRAFSGPEAGEGVEADGSGAAYLEGVWSERCASQSILEP
ncbi:hypothetical protein BKA70DRAFT_1560587 [Coprinopsis sp. MPI-PUGE-AT-0042]|nr:hypothetical protein BKA70DRAFT_1560587 [Coprinopsis sp. MPI-PUGE-AT-0042]